MTEVVLDAAGLADAEMQRIAGEVGYSETAFLTLIDPAERDSTGDLVFDTQAGTIPIHTDNGDTVVASLVSVPTRSRPITQPELDRTLAALRWPPEDLDPGWPPHVAFAGNDHPTLGSPSLEPRSRFRSESHLGREQPQRLQRALMRQAG